MVAKLNTMTAMTWGRFNNKGDVKCRHCPTDINPGDLYVRRRMSGRRGRNKTIIYCPSCAEILNIIVRDKD